MNMQEALKTALGAGLFARPVGDRHYTYSYEDTGKLKLLHVHGRDRFGVFRSDFWRTLSQNEVESEWLVCNREGDPANLNRLNSSRSHSIGPKGLTLSEMVA